MVDLYGAVVFVERWGERSLEGLARFKTRTTRDETLEITAANWNAMGWDGVMCVVLGRDAI